MGSMLRRAAALAASALLLAAAVALAAAPKKGATYVGATAHNDETITFKVSSNGKSVTANVAFPPLYCQGGSGPTRQVTKPASIGKSGSFSGSIGYEFIETHKITARLYFKGKFVSTALTGTARSEFGVGASPQAKKSLADCDGSTAFTAVAK
jgi:hypothetical protein